MATSYELNLGSKYNESLPSLGDVICDVIQLFGGNKIFGIGGDFAANLIAALDQRLNVLPSSNEMHAGFSACAQAEIDNIGFCLTTYMVGSLPCITSAGLAVTESLPVVFISGAPGESEINNQAIHHTIHPNASWKTQYDNALNAFSALGIKVERLQGDRDSSQPNIAGNRFYHLVAQAYKTKQPVFIEVPRDLVFAKTQLLNLPKSIDNIFWGDNVLSGSQTIVEGIMNKLQHAKAPMLYIGDKLKHNTKLKALIIKFAEKYNIQAMSINDLLADDSIDIVINLTIPAAHAKVSMQILNAGKHAYAEKPIAVTLEDGQAVMKLANEKGLQVGCAPDTFLGAGGQTARRLIDDGVIGRPVSANVFMFPDPSFPIQEYEPPTPLVCSGNESSKLGSFSTQADHASQFLKSITFL